MKLISHVLLGPQLASLLKIASAAALVAEKPHDAPASSSPAGTGTVGTDITNWEGGVTYHPVAVVKPQTIDDVVRVVTDTVRYPSPVRAVGKLHSPAPCSADDGGTMLDMTGMTRILEIGDDFVTAEAGALYIDIAEELARRGKQLHINTEIGNVTLGAVACAATKDSSLIGTSHWGQVSSFVSGVKLVRTDGTIVTYTETENPAEMRLIRSSYGLLGVIVEVTLKTKPMTAVSCVHRVYTLAGFRAAVPELVAQNYALMMYFYPFIDRVMVELRRELPGVAPTSSGGWWLRNAFWRTLGPMCTIFITRVSPNARAATALRGLFDRFITRATCITVRGKRTRPHRQIIRHRDKPGRIKFVFSMWSFEEARFFDVLEAYFRFCCEYADKTGFRCDLPAVGYRLVKDQNSLLSYAHDADAMSIDPACTGGPGWDDFLKAFNVFSSEYGGHPLFNQTKHLTPAQADKAYGARWEEFARARRAWDPHNRLLSHYFATLLGHNA
ncbi:MAG TPA: FAD-binding protein [Hyphomicrobium sp.]|nr:FAD-binding protein [Hyphomicrobium sp.]